jgi:hypothetical protein
MSKKKDTAGGAMQGAAVGTMISPGIGTAIGAGIGGLGGYFGIMPGTGGEDENAARQEAIDKGVDMLGRQGRTAFGQRQANLAAMGKIFGSANNQLEHMYGTGARVEMPEMSGPINDFFANTTVSGNPIHRAQPTQAGSQGVRPVTLVGTKRRNPDGYDDWETWDGARWVGSTEAMVRARDGNPIAPETPQPKQANPLRSRPR